MKRLIFVFPFLALLGLSGCVVTTTTKTEGGTTTVTREVRPAEPAYAPVYVVPYVVAPPPRWRSRYCYYDRPPCWW